MELLIKEWNLKDDEILIYMGHGAEHHANFVYTALNYQFAPFYFWDLPEISCTGMIFVMGYRKIMITQEAEGMLELQDICYQVDSEEGEKEILKHVNLKIEDGFVAITGPNGGGKSTLAKMIAGIIQPTSGRILFNGEDITGLSITERAKKGISFAFQQPVRFKGLTVLDLINLAHGEPISLTNACKYLSEVGLCAKDYINREVNGSLSGGELKRIEIAMIMARGTKLSIFDEPEAGIDLWSFNNLIRVFEGMREKIQGSIIIISHQERILNIADKIIVLSNGEVKAQGTKEEVLPELLTSSEACSTLMDKVV